MLLIMDIKLLIQQVNKLIKSHFADFKGTYFFGSRVHNNFTEDSDYDLLLTFEHKLNWKEKNLIYDIIADIEMKERIIIDIKTYYDRELKEIW
ncbi:unnamed protein product, partial [marine sediment metagenome]